MDDLEITKMKLNKDKTIKFLVRWEGRTKRFRETVVPFVIILAFVTSISTMMGMHMGLLFALVALSVALEIFFNSVNKLWKNEIKAELAIKENKGIIEELESDIKRLETKIKKKEDLSQRLKELKEEEKGGKNK